MNDSRRTARWRLEGSEVDLTDALDELEREYGALSFERETIDSSRPLTERRTLGDIGYVEILVTVIATKLTEDVINQAYARLKALLEKRRGARASEEKDTGGAATGKEDGDGAGADDDDAS